MPIDPVTGARLPYNGNGGPAMGGGPPMGGGRDATSIVNAGIDGTNASMGLNRQRGDVMAAKQRLMQIAAEAESILTEHPELAQEMMGQTPTPVGVPGGMPQTPVAANTGARRGGNADSRVGIDATNSAMGMGRGLIA